MAPDTTTDVQTDIAEDRQIWEQAVADCLQALTSGTAQLKRLAACVPSGGDPGAVLAWLIHVYRGLGGRTDVVNSERVRAKQIANDASIQTRHLEQAMLDLFQAVNTPLEGLLLEGVRPGPADRPIVAAADFGTDAYFVWFQSPGELQGTVLAATGAMGAPWKQLPVDHPVRQRLQPKDCFQANNGTPFVILGAPRVTLMSETAHPRPFYLLDDAGTELGVVSLTKLYRTSQIETQEARQRVMAQQNVAEYGPGWDGKQSTFISAEAEARALARQQAAEIAELRRRVEAAEAGKAAE